MQLLKITTTPLQYELEVEHARLEHNTAQDVPRADVQTQPMELSIDTKNTEVHIDTYEARKSIGLSNTKDSLTIRAQKAQQSVDEATRNYVELGKQLSNTADGVTIGKIVKQKMIEQPEMYTAFLPNASAEISWEPSSVSYDFKPQESNYNWQLSENQFNYIPGSVKMTILQKASVEIEYLGGPQYVPKSASPDYNPGE